MPTSAPHVEADCTGTCSSCPAAGTCPDRVVCHCLRVEESVVIGAIREMGARTVRDLKDLTGAGDGCMCCHRELKVYLTIYSSADSGSPNMCSAR